MEGVTERFGASSGPKRVDKLMFLWQGDFLLIVLKNLIEKQSAQNTPKLKVILMSATVDSHMFSHYFGHCPVITAKGRTHPVSTYFLEDVYENINYRLASDSPASITYESSAPQKSAPVNNRRGMKNLVLSAWGDESLLSEDSINPYYNPDNYQSYSEQTRLNLKRLSEDIIDYDLLEDLVCHIDETYPEGAILVFLPGVAEIYMLLDKLAASYQFGGQSSEWLLPLHSSVASVDQKRAFLKPPDNIRKVIIATNIAETSITIDDVVYVVDCGKHKENRYNPQKESVRKVRVLLPAIKFVVIIGWGKLVELGLERVLRFRIPGKPGQHKYLVLELRTVTQEQYLQFFNGFWVPVKLSSMVEDWISQANARQRRGRAGRVKPGICFCLYTCHRFEKLMRPYQIPEMLRMPLVELCLQIKLLSLGNVKPFLSQALEPPREEAINSAISLLYEVGAIEGDEELTPLGYHLAKLPVDVLIGKQKYILVSAAIRDFYLMHPELSLYAHQTVRVCKPSYKPITATSYTEIFIPFACPSSMITNTLMMIYGGIFGCLSPILSISAFLSYKSPFVYPKDELQNVERAKLALLTDKLGSATDSDNGNRQSDHLVMMVAYKKWDKILREVGNCEHLL
ncbi:unnamed protein product [Ilex paraguariensis]|uniref:RNA helicase n=1 Tax=Ilex paraguariensis TaxID=185542 RepID=A0ABC8TEM5_9AQUA